MKLTKIMIGLVLCLALVCGSLYAAPQCTKKCDKECALKAKPSEMKETKMSPQQLMDNLKSHQFNGELINLNLKDADLKNVMAFFAKYSGLNFTVAEGITGSVTIEKNQVKWDEMLHHLLEEHKLTLTEKENGFEVNKAK